MKENENVSKKFKNWFTNNSFYFFTFLISAVYIGRGIITIDETGKTIAAILSDGLLFLAVGYIISLLFNFQGILNGYKTVDVTTEKTKHDNLVTASEPYTSNMDDFCKNKNFENLKTVRTRILQRMGMAYADYFNEDSSAKDVVFDFDSIEKIDKIKTIRFGKNRGKETTKKVKDKYAINKLKEKRKQFKQAIKVELTQLTPDVLISESAKANDRFNLGQTIQGYLQKTSASGFIFQIIGAILFGYYVPGLIQDFSWAALIWTSLQVVWFLAMGFVKYYTSYFYMQNGYVGRIKKQNKYLTEIVKIYGKPDDNIINKLKEDITKEIMEKYEVIN